MGLIRRVSEQVLIATEDTGDPFDATGPVVVSIEGTYPTGTQWVVQSARRDGTRVWANEFQPGDALTDDIRMAQIPGSPSRVYRVARASGTNVGLVAFVDDTPGRQWV